MIEVPLFYPFYLFRCGLTTVSAHSCVLASISRFFARLVAAQSKRASWGGVQGGLLDVDVGQLFRGIENHFSSLVDALYAGKRLVSRTVDLNKALGHVYAALELEPSIDFQVQIREK